MTTVTKRITLKNKPPAYVHRKFENGQLISTNQNTDKRIVYVRTRLEVVSNNFFAYQNVRELDGETTIQDVFEYNDLYVILRKNCDKIAVLHDEGDNWHIAQAGELSLAISH